jgi:hypothetical protein
MNRLQARERRTPLPGRDGRAVIVRIVMPALLPCAAARDVMPEGERDPDAEPGRGRLGCLLHRLQSVDQTRVSPWKDSQVANSFQKCADHNYHHADIAS